MSESLETFPSEPIAPGKNMERLSLNILFADDEEAIRFMAPLIFKSMGHTVETVRNGEELIARLASAKPGEFNLVITDNNMGSGIEGVDAITIIRTDNRFNHLKSLPIILSSGMPSEELKSRVGNLNSIFLEKPAELEDFKVAIEKAFAKFTE